MRAASTRRGNNDGSSSPSRFAFLTALILLAGTPRISNAEADPEAKNGNIIIKRNTNINSNLIVSNKHDDIRIRVDDAVREHHTVVVGENTRTKLLRGGESTANLLLVEGGGGGEGGEESNIEGRRNLQRGHGKRGKNKGKKGGGGGNQDGGNDGGGGGGGWSFGGLGGGGNGGGGDEESGVGFGDDDNTAGGDGTTYGYGGGSGGYGETYGSAYGEGSSTTSSYGSSYGGGYGGGSSTSSYGGESSSGYGSSSSYREGSSGSGSYGSSSGYGSGYGRSGSSSKFGSYGSSSSSSGYGSSSSYSYHSTGSGSGFLNAMKVQIPLLPVVLLFFVFFPLITLYTAHAFENNPEGVYANFCRLCLNTIECIYRMAFNIWHCRLGDVADVVCAMDDEDEYGKGYTDEELKRMKARPGLDRALDIEHKKAVRKYRKRTVELGDMK